MAITLAIDAIHKLAAKFAKSYENIKSEKRYGQNFMRDFCEVFGINNRRIEWQHKTKTVNWMDGFIPGMLLFEIASKKVARTNNQSCRIRVANFQSIRFSINLTRIHCITA